MEHVLPEATAVITQTQFWLGITSIIGTLSLTVSILFKLWNADRKAERERCENELRGLRAQHDTQCAELNAKLLAMSEDRRKDASTVGNMLGEVARSQSATALALKDYLDEKERRDERA